MSVRQEEELCLWDRRRSYVWEWGRVIRFQGVRQGNWLWMRQRKFVCECVCEWDRGIMCVFVCDRGIIYVSVSEMKGINKENWLNCILSYSDVQVLKGLCNLYMYLNCKYILWFKSIIFCLTEEGLW